MFDPVRICQILNEEGQRAANRPKDQMALPYLESLRDERRDR